MSDDSVSKTKVGTPPDISQGFGKVDLAATVGLYGSQEKVVFKDETTALDTGQEERGSHFINSGGRTLKVTLVWTGYPGEALQNDLDLIVTTGSQKRHGNVTTGSTDFDCTSNVEQVLWPDVSQGTVTSLRAHIGL